MAAGAVVVTTPIGLEDYVQDGHNAIVVPPRNPRAAANAVLDALSASATRRRQWQEAGQATARRHTWQAAVIGFEQAIERGLTTAPQPDIRPLVMSELGIPLISG
jgi:glycosyltransferase involved in cell wall biosynthesis